MTNRTDVSYNGITLENCLTKMWDETAVYDSESETDVVYHKVRLTVSCLVHDVVGSGPVGTFPQVGNSIVDFFSYIKAQLMETRKPFAYSVGGVPLVSLQGPGSYVANADVNNGPKPIDVKLVGVSPKLFKIEFTIELAIVDCNNDTNTQGVLSNRWSMMDSYDTNWFCNRTVRGRLRIATLNLNAQSFRSWVVPPLQSGFKREAMHFTTSADGLTLEYIITDRQVFASCPMPGTTWTCDHSESTNDGASSVSEIAIHLEGPPNSNKKALVALGAKIAESVLQINRYSTDDMVDQIGFVDHMHDSTIDVILRLRRTTTPEYFTAIGASIGDPLSLPGYDPKVSAEPTDIDLASPAGLFMCYLQTPCDDNHKIGNSSSITSPGGIAELRNTVPVVTMSQGTLVATRPPDWSSEQKRAMYTEYLVDSKYKTNAMTLALPIAASSSGPSNGMTTRATVSLAPPQTTRTIKITAERFGDWPEIPDLLPTYQDPTGQAVLVGRG
ncbi:MAG TPA: hypothetical protein VGG64_23530, partial [Pirellulales bacterium]